MRHWQHAWLGVIALTGSLMATGCDPDVEQSNRQSSVPPSAVATSEVSSPAASPPATPPSTAALPSTRETAQATPHDIALAARIEAALAAETALHGSAIAVKAADGVVTLSGSTKDPALRSMAAQVALSIAGVRSVRNELTISADV
jgi:osmotically-inducible protein OsmY